MVEGKLLTKNVPELELKADLLGSLLVFIENDSLEIKSEFISSLI